MDPKCKNICVDQERLLNFFFQGLHKRFYKGCSEKNSQNPLKKKVII